jgi:hypothetical protein
LIGKTGLGGSLQEQFLADRVKSNISLKHWRVFQRIHNATVRRYSKPPGNVKLRAGAQKEAHKAKIEDFAFNGVLWLEDNQREASYIDNPLTG